MTGRQTKLSIDLGKEQVSLRRVDASEELGRPFSIMVEIVAEHGEIDLLPHLGKPATITLSEEGEFMRYFNGIIVEGEYLAMRHDGDHYRLLLRPWTHLMAHTRNFAIFQDMNALDIAKQIFVKYPAAKVDYGHISSGSVARDYCVQYGESDFEFVTRLFEEEGIYYFFEHSNEGHVMVLCDGKQSHAKGTPEALSFNPTAAGIGNVSSAAVAAAAGRAFVVTSWRERVSTGAEAKVTLRDFNFETPAKPLEDLFTMEKVHPADVNEVYDWPGGFKAQGKGVAPSRHMLQAMRANRRCINGESPSLSLACGSKFTMKSHPVVRYQGKDYLITRTHHVTSIEVGRSNDGGEQNSVFFEVVPAETDWLPLPSVRRPQVKGPETAIVTGPDSEEIFTDKYGRVKVRFHWDRAGTPGEKSTCWIRVSQTGGLGNIILPRVGHEVIVDFLNGDPDRPIVVGRVFNATNMPVYGLPDNKTRALWRTKTYMTKDGTSFPGAADMDVEDIRANELRFEDKAGEEEVFLHAERDMKTRVRFKESHHVGLDQEIKVGNDRNEYVKNNETVKIDGARSVEIKQSDTLDVKKEIKIDSGTEISITAKSKITLTVGSSSITIDPAGIKIEAPATLDAKSAMTTVKGDGMLTLKGGMTMIN